MRLPHHARTCRPAPARAAPPRALHWPRVPETLTGKRRRMIEPLREEDTRTFYWTSYWHLSEPLGGGKEGEEEGEFEGS